MWPILGKEPDKALISHEGWSNDHLARGGGEALDLAVWTGTPICSKISGEITQAGWRGAAGLAVTTTATVNGHTLVSRECHLDSISVTVGQQVVGGQEIGLSGNTGQSDGPHLHTLLEIDTSRVRLEDFFFGGG